MKGYRKYLIGIIALGLNVFQTASADNVLHWKVELESLYSSYLIVSNDDSELARYKLECNLAASKSEGDDAPVTIKQFSLPDERRVIGVTCPFGAHSQMLVIIDPYTSPKEPAFKVVGSYFAYFDEAKDRVNIVYDRYCSEQRTDCDGFEQVRAKWPLQ